VKLLGFPAPQGEEEAGIFALRSRSSAQFRSRRQRIALYLRKLLRPAANLMSAKQIARN
jgi:hypothetical protein